MTSPYYPRGGYRPYNEWQAVGSGLREIGRMLGEKRRFEQTQASDKETRDLNMAVRLAQGGGHTTLPEGADPNDFVQLPGGQGFMPRKKPEVQPWDRSEVEQQRELDWNWRKANPIGDEPKQEWQTEGYANEEEYLEFLRQKHKATTYPPRKLAGSTKATTPPTLGQAQQLVREAYGTWDGEVYVMPDGATPEWFIAATRAARSGADIPPPPGVVPEPTVAEEPKEPGKVRRFFSKLGQSIAPGGETGFWGEWGASTPEERAFNERGGAAADTAVAPEPTEGPLLPSAGGEAGSFREGSQLVPTMAATGPSREATASRARELATQYANLPQAQRDAKIIQIMTGEGYHVR